MTTSEAPQPVPPSDATTPPADAIPATAPSDAVPSDAVPADACPSDAVPGEPVVQAEPVDGALVDALPADTVLADAVPSDASPGDAAVQAEPAVAADGADGADESAAPAAAPAEGTSAQAGEATSPGADHATEAAAPSAVPADPRLLLAREAAPGPADLDAAGAQPAAAAPVVPEVAATPVASPAPASAGGVQPAAASVASPASASASASAGDVQPAAALAQGASPAPAPAPAPPVPAVPVPAPHAPAGAWQQPVAGVAGYPYAGGGQAAPQGVWALPPQYAPKVRKERPWLRTVGRWATAVGVLAVVGTVTAALVTAPARTDLPGLKTPSDGRWAFPALTLPTLPPGNGQGNDDAQHVHRVDLRSLLLPAPAGATAESGLPGTGGWYPTSSLLGLFTSSSAFSVKEALQDAGLRHVAATGWTMPDGTHTEIYLQQFRSTSSASDADMEESVGGYLRAAPTAAGSGNVNLSSLPAANIHAAPAAGGQPAVTYAYLPVGDTEALVVMSNPKQVPAVDFEQVVLLEHRLLSA
ncbi:hypothetical protein ABH931_000204 [Streptacidiphilus sp. MAP12-33]|uniref:hypothetical protein n=1 Tax=Streptacidiphilus sp. MAP12-33 TaxID=3156266 RepID=UPI00351151DE